ncbi:hypothetical protein RYX36_001678 [Vicia faba]
MIHYTKTITTSRVHYQKPSKYKIITFHPSTTLHRSFTKVHYMETFIHKPNPKLPNFILTFSKLHAMPNAFANSLHIFSKTLCKLHDHANSKPRDLHQKDKIHAFAHSTSSLSRGYHVYDHNHQTKTAPALNLTLILSKSQLNNQLT